MKNVVINNNVGAIDISTIGQRDDYVLAKYGSLTPRFGRKVQPKTWKEDYLKEYGIEHIADSKDLPFGDNVIYMTSCTGIKSELKRGIPKDMYISHTNQQFYRQMDKIGEKYATLTGYPGVFFDDEEFNSYNEHASMYKWEEIQYEFANIVKNKLTSKGYDTIVFCYSSPLMSELYLKRLSYTGLKVYYVTKISMIERPTV